PDGTKVLLRYTQFSFATQLLLVFTRYDVIDAATGAPIGTDLPLAGNSPNVFRATPRWLPDSSGVYGVDAGGTTVTLSSPDGQTTSTLYTLANTDSVLDDFVVAPTYSPASPSSSRCGYVRTDNGVV